MNKELNEKIIEIALRICKRKEGALIIVGEADYTPLVEQEVEPFNIINNPKLLESLALMDGACIINQNGFLKAYGVKIKSNFTWKNFGTKHSAGYSASIKNDTTAYVISEEDTTIRIFKEGKLILEIDGRQKDIEKKIPEISKIIESIGWGTLGTIGMGLLAPALGIVITSGITIFAVTTGITYTIKKLQDLKIIR
jgi:hypothetical protein